MMKMTQEEKEADIAEAVRSCPAVCQSTGVISESGEIVLVFWAKADVDGPVSKFVWFFDTLGQMDAYINAMSQMRDVAKLKSAVGIIQVTQ